MREAAAAPPPPPRSLLARARPLMLARGAGAALSFVIPLVLARAFDPAQYGTYKLLVLIAQTLSFVLPMGMSQSLYYFLPREAERRPYLVQTLTFLLAVGVLAAVAVGELSVPLSHWLNNPGLVPYAPALGVYTLGITASMPLEVAQTARGQTARAALTYLVSDSLKAAAMTLPALAGWGLRGVVVGMSAFALARLVATWAVLLPGQRGPLFDGARLRQQLRWAVPFGAAIALSVPQNAFHQYVVSAHVTAAAFAVYSVGIVQVPIIDLLYTPTSEILMVRIAELEREGRVSAAAAAFREAVARLAGVFVPLSIFLIAAAPEFIGALFTQRYLAAVPIFRTIASAILLACLPVDGALRARNQTRHIFVCYLVKAAITVPLVLVAVGRYGMLGGAASWLAAEVVGKALLMARAPSALGTRLVRLIPWGELSRTGAAAALALGGVFASRAALGGAGGAGGAAPRLLGLLAAAAAFGFAYLVAVLALGGELPFGIAIPGRAGAKVPGDRGEP